MLTVVVILGCRPDGDYATPEMVNRVRCGVETANGIVKGECIMLFSGGRTAGTVSEASIMHRVYEKSFPAASIPAMLENSSLDTIGNAYFCSALLKHLDYTRVVIVTSPYHINRSKYLFSFMLGHRVSGSTFGPVPGEYTPEERKSFMMAREMLRGVKKGDIDGIWKRMVELHPLYSEH